ncbi:MAG: hypothetical protein ACRY3E_04500 [Candidatus Lariskella arthropodorum]
MADVTNDPYNTEQMTRFLNSEFSDKQLTRVSKIMNFEHSRIASLNQFIVPLASIKLEWQKTKIIALKSIILFFSGNNYLIFNKISCNLAEKRDAILHGSIKLEENNEVRVLLAKALHKARRSIIENPGLSQLFIASYYYNETCKFKPYSAELYQDIRKKYGIKSEIKSKTLFQKECIEKMQGIILDCIGY